MNAHLPQVREALALVEQALTIAQDEALDTERALIARQEALGYDVAETDAEALALNERANVLAGDRNSLRTTQRILTKIVTGEV